MRRKSVLLPVSCIFLLALAQGCASTRKYAWNDYDSVLYVHYKKPMEKEAHLERLKEIVTTAEAEDRVPPGLYAECGYCYFEMGNMYEAILYFEKEKAKWPESNVLMEKMIRNARRRQETMREPSMTESPRGQEGVK